jgi:hypothetical protein
VGIGGVERFLDGVDDLQMGQRAAGVAAQAGVAGKHLGRDALRRRHGAVPPAEDADEEGPALVDAL